MRSNNQSSIAIYRFAHFTHIRENESTTSQPSKAVASGYWSSPTVIALSRFKYKSLCNWSCNTAVGCSHGCRFCYVPSTSTIKQTPKLSRLGVQNPDAEWGNYVFPREWNEKTFLASLAVAEAMVNLPKDGHRAIMLSTTTDPYQVIPNASPAVSKKLTTAHTDMVRRILELIFERSRLRVRVLTRSPLAEKDFRLMKAFGPRLMFGMSLPTLNDKLAKIYEPGAPGVRKRLETLQKAKEEGLNVYVAVAPTFPECDEQDLLATLQAVKDLDPFTVFHEPINIRADNAARIAEHAARLGQTINTSVFENGIKWRIYAIQQFMLVEKIAVDLGIHDRLHLWPDADLVSITKFEEMRRYLREGSGNELTPLQKARVKADDDQAHAQFKSWLDIWCQRSLKVHQVKSG